MPLHSSQSIEVHIRPSASWWDVDWRGLAHYQDLLWLMVRRDFVSKYKQTVLGPAWMVIQPLATTLVFTVIFSRVAKLSTDGTPAPLFYLSGLLGWNLFAGILGGTGNVLQSNAGLFGKVYFPRLIVPLANSVSAIIPFGIQLLTFLVMLAFYGGGVEEPVGAPPVWVRVFLFPMCEVQVMVTGLGLGLLFSALTAVYRDLQHVQGFIIQILMYLTPVIYPLSQFPEHWRWIPQINPLSVPVEGIRMAFLGTGCLEFTPIALSWGLSLGLLFTGFAFFNRTEKDYIDRS